MKHPTMTLITLSLVALLLGACVPPPAQPQAGTDGPSTVAIPTATPAAAADPLPSWNPGPAKNTILQFVADVTDQAGPSYVPPADRIAVFDNDGTLWTEKELPPPTS